MTANAAPQALADHTIPVSNTSWDWRYAEPIIDRTKFRPNQPNIEGPSGARRVARNHPRRKTTANVEAK